MFHSYNTNEPDPHALALARRIQELMPRDTVFLCVTRAGGGKFPTSTRRAPTGLRKLRSAPGTPKNAPVYPEGRGKP